MKNPRVSILIPNFNNGAQSSKDGQTDLISDLLDSLWTTLADDPTPLEIIAFDDGSSDDSLETLRQWAGKTWPDGSGGANCGGNASGGAFLKLMEAPHCGILSITANKLVRESRGEILVRLDGDIVIHTPNWAQKLCDAFDDGPADLGVIGPKQLAPTGAVHSMGDFLLHPKGYHHVAEGMPADLITRSCEVDHVMGCFYCCKRSVYDQLGGFDEAIMRGQTVDFGMRSRLAGVRCWAIPTIEFTHRHTLRQDRATTADTDRGVDDSRQVFRDKWGFDRIAPDLDVAREKYKNTPLLWNANIFGVPAGYAQIPTSAEPTTFEQSEWVRFNSDQAFQDWTRFKVSAALQLIEQELGAITRPAIVLGCGSGIVVHLLAMQGIQAIGVERNPQHVQLAKQFSEQHQQRASYPAARYGSLDKSAPAVPRFVVQTELRAMPLEDGCADLVCLFDQMEAHDNPVSLIHEARRLAGGAGSLLAVSKCPDMKHDEPLNPYQRYLPKQLASQIKAATDWQTMIEVLPKSPGRPIVVFATGREDLLNEPAESESASQAPACAAPATTA